jgi:hypothetical protein
MTGCQNRVLIIQEGKKILEDFEVDGKCKIPE